MRKLFVFAAILATAFWIAGQSTNIWAAGGGGVRAAEAAVARVAAAQGSSGAAGAAAVQGRYIR